MRVVIRSRAIEFSGALRARVARRAQCARGRVASEVRRAAVGAGVNGPRGGLAEAGRILVRGPRLDQVRAERAEATAAVAADRASRAVGRSIDRQRWRLVPAELT